MSGDNHVYGSHGRYSLYTWAVLTVFMVGTEGGIYGTHERYLQYS